MQNKIIIEYLKRHFDPSFEMLEKIIADCPESIWYKTLSGFPVWHQVYHTLESINFWFSPDKRKYEPDTFNKIISAELGTKSKDSLSKKEILQYLCETKIVIQNYFDSFQSTDYEINDILKDGKFTKIDEILVQIRHMQYHIGHFNSIFRENDIKAVEWIGYGE